MIEIRNAQNYFGDGEYVGRKTPTRKVGSPLANQFKMKSNTLDERIRVIMEFRNWLWKEMQNLDSAAYKEIHRLADIYVPERKDSSCESFIIDESNKLVLICWCAPNPCHAEVIANAVRWVCDEEPVKYSWK